MGHAPHEDVYVIHVFGGIVSLIDKDLSEPYSVFTYRHPPATRSGRAKRTGGSCAWRAENASCALFVDGDRFDGDL